MAVYVCKDCKVEKPPEEFKKNSYGVTRTCLECFSTKVKATLRAKKRKKEQEQAQKSELETPVEVEETPESNGPESNEPELVEAVVDLFDRISEVFADAANLLRR